MWFLYIEGHGIYEYTDPDELKDAANEWLLSHQLEAIRIIEGKDITSQVISDKS